MRAYFFGNMYLSSIQQGIQAAHATHEMFTKYRNQVVPEKALYDWAIDHKTMILLNGGYAETIQELVFFFDRQPGRGIDYPFAPFYEEKASLNGALTTVGIILPEKIYQVAAAIRNERVPVWVQGEEGTTRPQSIREKIWDDGEITIGPGNLMGFDIDKEITFEYTKWEAELIDRLNQFDKMAS